MSITVDCPSCNRSFIAPDTSAGKTGKCPKCGERIVIPVTPEAPDTDNAVPVPPALPTPANAILQAVAPCGLTFRQGIAIIAILSIGVGSQLVQFRAKPPSVVKWEYKIDSPSDASFEREINRLGTEGWELVSARRATGGFEGASYEMILKRPVQ